MYWLNPVATAFDEMKIDVTEQFQHLPKAPIVEAVIEVRARSEATWDEQFISEQLKSKLPDYPRVTSQRELQQEVKFESGQPPEATQHDLGWKGLRFQSADGRHLAQFNRNGFVFSRMKPYENWEQLLKEAMRLWRIHTDEARPTTAHQIGLRFINRISLPVQEFKFEDYIQPHPAPPHGLDSLLFNGYFHHDALAVPGHPYVINLVRTIQPPQDPAVQGLGLILDIDVITTQPFELSDGMLETRLAEMCWLKNKAFFGSITKTALKSFQ